MSDSQHGEFDGASLVDEVSAAGAWRLHRGGSRVAFAVRHIWGLITVRGTFEEFDGSAVVGVDGTIAASVTVHAASIDTRQRMRDRHLRNDSFFDVQRYPTFAVQADDIRLTSATTATVRGELVLRGVARSIAFDAELVPATGRSNVTVDATALVDRTAFGITWSPLRMTAAEAVVTVHLVFERADGPAVV